MKKWKNRLDEMQEQKMLRIEHNGCWLAFWGLVIALFAQLIYYGPDCADKIIGEFVMFMCLAIYIAAACVKNGIWDRKLAPTWKMNLCASLLAGVVGGIVRFLILFRAYQSVEACGAAGVITGINIFIICFVVLSISLLVYKWRENHAERDEPDEPEKK